MELIPLVEEELVLKGFGERKWAEKRNLCHLTTLLIPVVRQDSAKFVQIQIRDRKKSFPCCRDVFGGHVTLNQEFWQLLLGEPFELSQIVLTAAVREANEELRARTRETSDPYVMTDKGLRQVGGVGKAGWDREGNVERSTIFLVPIPDNCVTHPMDDIDGVFRPVKTKLVDWQSLRTNFLNNKQYACESREKAQEAGCNQNRMKWQFADGAARILKDEGLFKMVLVSIDALTDNDFKPVLG
jgi:hypothetical protein